MTTLTPIYGLIGVVIAIAAVRVARDATRPRRFAAATFWGVLAVLVAGGDWIPPVVVGAAVVALALIAGFGGVQRPALCAVNATPGATDTVHASPPSAGDDAASSPRGATAGDARVFVPALLVPVFTVIGVFALKRLTRDGVPMFDGTQASLLALAIACVVAFAVACISVRRAPTTGLAAGADLVDAIGWPLMLPLVLATLGALFQAAGAGDAIASIVGGVVPVDDRLACVIAYALGMALFTMVMGNAFAAFPVITAGIGLPLLVMRHGADPASMAALGMLSGYCGTLMTPMAANFNIVPALLLELRDQHAVIRAQVPTALMLLAANVVLMYYIVFR